MARRTLRLPDEMDKRVAVAAAEDRRSVQGEIEWLLQDALDRRNGGREPHPATQEAR